MCFYICGLYVLVKDCFVEEETTLCVFAVHKKANSKSLNF